MDIIDLLQTYGTSAIIIILLIVIAAMSKGFGIWDNIWGRVKGHFDKEHAKTEWQKRMEKQATDTEVEQQALSQKIVELQKTDQQILEELSAIREMLNEQTRIDDERYADATREYILRFNMELVHEMKHTHENFIEVMSKIDDYERYYRHHADYENNHAVAAIQNVKRVYADRLAKNDFA